MSAQRIPAVLVVDDLDSFSRLIRHALAQRRFAVFCATSAAKGLALFQAHQSQIDLAVIDIVRPAAANLDLTAELERLQPGPAGALSCRGAQDSRPLQHRGAGSRFRIGRAIH
jgi:DNA-binding response OmpR family regulator